MCIAVWGLAPAAMLLRIILKIAYMKSQLIALFLVFPFVAFSQSFKGRLVYKFYTNLKEDEVDLKRGWDYKSELNNLTLHCYIDENKLLTVEKTQSGKILFNKVQQDGIAYLSGSQDSIPYGQLHPLGESPLVFEKKTKEEKYIMGIKCTKYIYRLGEETQIRAWIADGFVYKDQVSLGKFFLHFIFPHGLVFEKEIIYKDIVNQFKLVGLEFLEDWGDKFPDLKLDQRQ